MHFKVIEILNESKAAKELLEIKRKEFTENVDFYNSLYSKLCELYDSYLSVTLVAPSEKEQKNYLDILNNADFNFTELQNSIKLSGEIDTPIYAELQIKIAAIQKTIQKFDSKQSDESTQADQLEINTQITKLSKAIQSTIETEKTGSIDKDVKASQCIENYTSIQRENKKLGGRIALLDPNNPETLAIYRAALDKDFTTTAFRVIEACISWHRHFGNEDGDVFLPQLLEKFLPITNESKKTLPQIAVAFQGKGREKNYFSQQLEFLKIAADATNFDVSHLIIKAEVSKPSHQPTRSRAATFFNSFLRKPVEDKPKVDVSPSQTGYFSKKISEKLADKRLNKTNQRIRDFTAFLSKLSEDAKSEFKGYGPVEFNKAYDRLVEINYKCIEKTDRYQLPELTTRYSEYGHIIETYTRISEQSELLMIAIRSAAKSNPAIPPGLTRSQSGLLNPVTPPELTRSQSDLRLG